MTDTLLLVSFPIEEHGIPLFIGGGLVTKSCPTLVTPGTIAHQAPLSMGFFQARVLEWVAISSPLFIRFAKIPTHPLSTYIAIIWVQSIIN